MGPRAKPRRRPRPVDADEFRLAAPAVLHGVLLFVD